MSIPHRPLADRAETMPDQDLERAREVFLSRLAHEGVGLLAQQPLVAYWQSVEAEARVAEELDTVERWSRALARDKDKLEELRNQARSVESNQLGGEDALVMIRHILALLDAIEGRINRRLAVLRDRMGRWVFLAGPGVKKKPPEGDEKPDDKKTGKTAKEEQAKRALIQRPKPKDKPSKIKAM